MNSEIKVNENKFNLTILGVLLITVCSFVTEVIFGIFFRGISEIRYLNSYNILELIVGLLAQIIPRILSLLVVLKMIKKDYKANFKISYIRKFNFKLLLCTVFLMIGFFLWFQTLFAAIIEKLPALKSFAEGASEVDKNFYVDIIISVTVAPIYEEIIMRGIILEGLLNKYKPIIGIIISSFIFGVLHFSVLTSINAAIGGMLFGYIYYKTRSLVLCIACHMVHNSMTYFIVIFNSITFLIGITIFITAIVFFERCLKRLDLNDASLKKNIV